jgi:hypothetical protein
MPDSCARTVTYPRVTPAQFLVPAAREFGLKPGPLSDSLPGNAHQAGFSQSWERLP